VASPLYGQRASSLIQQSITTAKTCRPNRGRSRAPVSATPLLVVGGSGSDSVPIADDRSVARPAFTRLAYATARLAMAPSR
jgi:hypothetical protein